MKPSIEITLATIDLSFHRAASAVVQAILMRHGIAVREMLAPHEAAFELLKNGTADMLCSAWLPSSHGVYPAQPSANYAERILETRKSLVLTT